MEKLCNVLSVVLQKLKHVTMRNHENNWRRFTHSCRTTAGTVGGAATGATVGRAIGTVAGPLGVIVGGTVGTFVGAISAGITGGVVGNIFGKIKSANNRQEYFSRLSLSKM